MKRKGRKDGETSQPPGGSALGSVLGRRTGDVLRKSAFLEPSAWEGPDGAGEVGRLRAGGRQTHGR